MSVHFLHVRSLADLAQIPSGDAVIGICGGGRGDRLIRARCMQGSGVIEAEVHAGERRSVAFVALQNGPSQEDFLARARATPSRAWIVFASFELDVAVAALTLADRASPEPVSDTRTGEIYGGPETQSGRCAHMHALIAKVDEATRFACGWISQFPGIQRGYTHEMRWLQHGEPNEICALAGAQKLVNWVNDGTLTHHQARLALKPWLEGAKVDTHAYFDEPRQAAVEAASHKDVQAVLAAATQAAWKERDELVRRLENASVRPTYPCGPEVPIIDLRGTPIPAYEGGRVAFATATVCLVIYPAPDGAFNRYGIWFFREALNAERLQAILCVAEGPRPRVRWERLESGDVGFNALTSEGPVRSGLGPGAIIDAIERCRR